MLDAGMHTGKSGFAALPFFDDFDLSTVDILLISQLSPQSLLLPPGQSANCFHLDHAAALPYVLAKTNFKGRVFMTHPTKAIYKWLIQDSVRVSNTSSTSDQSTNSLYSEADHNATLPLIETIDFYTTHTVSSVRITPYPAGHVLGAAMFLINIAGLNIFFTGDYSREPDRHLVSAAVPQNVGKIDVLISESTFGISNAPPRAEREAALLKSVTGILNRGGRVLMPVFALGRAQELLLILEDYWERHPELQKYPIYYTGNTARKCMVIYQTYINAMNDNIKRIFRERMAEAEASGNAKGVSAGPWDFKYVRSLRNLERFDDVGGCVMLASPGVLQSGMSRVLLERWAPDQRNGVVMTGYNPEGTMARTILQEPDSIPAVMTAGAGQGMSKKDDNEVMIPRRCTVDEYSFAAHVTGVENVEFIEEMGAKVVILVHGERQQMTRLKSKLLSLNAGKTEPVKILTPVNGEEVRIPFKKDKVAKVVGRLASIHPPKTADEQDTQLLSGVLVQNGFKLSLMAPEDLSEYAGLTTTTVMCKQHITLAAAGVELIKWALTSTFGAIEEIGGSSSLSNGNKVTNGELTTNGHGIKEDEEADEELPSGSSRVFLVMGCVTITWREQSKQAELEWEGNAMNDGIADAVMAVLLTVESSPAAVKYSSSKHHDHHSHSSQKQRNIHAEVSPEERFARLCMFLEEQFGPTITPIETQRSKHTLETSTDNIKEDLTDEDQEEAEASERARLAALGIPVPGLEIRVDKNVAKIWLETLEVECTAAVLRDRVKAVVERAVETVAPMWSVKGLAHR
ncbi:putative cleavage and polyadenylation specifity 73 kda [Phaeomoniella chlamydospora]|uniref:Endoribonuclease YSH1 n=1 Tax=Phaeomoniella chlamydospora TaxID=158046 RepID=A0A0G2F309_PHACM|nr:putative cleavage and polyadenylation specifity 73 kda [Phaeomoniella chlamydospora]